MTARASLVGKRIGVLVFNDASRDARVLKSADALAAAGAEVRIVAFSAYLQAPAGEERRGPGVTIQRVPVVELDHVPARAGARARRALGAVRGGTGAPRTVGRVGGSQPRAGGSDEEPTSGPRVQAAAPGLHGPKRWVVDQWMRLHHTIRLASYQARAVGALMAWRPDCVHANDANTLVPAWLVARRLGIPFVYDSHELWTHRIKAGSRPVARRWEAWVERRLAPRADAVVTVSPGVADWLHSNLRLRRRPALVRNVPHLAGDVSPETGRLREMAGLASTDRVVVHIGAATIGRGLDHVVDALAHLPQDVHLVLLGPTTEAYLRRLRNRAAAAGTERRVHHVGAVPPEGVAAAAADADVSVVSIEPLTLSLRHSLPNKLFESIHAGLPLVAADLPDMREVVLRTGAGVVTDFTDPAATARCILELLADPAPRRAAARAAARQLTWQAEAERLVDVHATALDRRSPRRARWWRAARRAGVFFTRHRRRLPARLDRSVEAAIAAAPPRLRDLYEQAVYGFTAHDRVVPPPLPRTERRLYVAPTNYAGQAHAIVRALERELDGVGGVTMKAMPDPPVQGVPVDMAVPKTVYLASSLWQERQRAYVGQFSHVVVESGQTLYSPAAPGAAEAEIRELLERGVHVALLFHGTDIRLPSRHLAAEPWSPFGLPPYVADTRYEQNAAAHRALADALQADGVPAFVTTPDLLLDLPAATWVPVVVEPARWRGAARADILERDVPVVVHAPSRSSIKGTDLVEPALRGLHERGMIDYRRVEGVPWHRMPQVYGDADIVVDQMRLGSYGVAACEAMAAGRLVVSHVSEQVRGHVRSASGLELPVVEANGADLVRRIEQVVRQREEYRALAAQGPVFVEAVHDGRLTAHALGKFVEADR